MKKIILLSAMAMIMGGGADASFDGRDCPNIAGQKSSVYTLGYGFTVDGVTWKVLKTGRNNGPTIPPLTKHFQHQTEVNLEESQVYCQYGDLQIHSYDHPVALELNRKAASNNSSSGSSSSDQ